LYDKDNRNTNSKRDLIFTIVAQEKTILFEDDEVNIDYTLKRDKATLCTKASIFAYPEKFNQMIPNEDFDYGEPESPTNPDKVRKWAQSPEGMEAFTKSLAPDYYQDLVDNYKKSKASAEAEASVTKELLNAKY